MAFHGNGTLVISPIRHNKIPHTPFLVRIVYPVNLIVTNVYGCSIPLDAPVTINVGLNNSADFNVDTNAGCAPLLVQFTSNNFTAVNYFWNFGDGNTSLTGSPSHNYLTGGNYTVTLIVSDVMGCADTVVKQNLIHVEQ